MDVQEFPLWTWTNRNDCGYVIQGYKVIRLQGYKVTMLKMLNNNVLHSATQGYITRKTHGEPYPCD
jgi:hypothetical protein